jgi:hypothetical protein
MRTRLAAVLLAALAVAPAAHAAQAQNGPQNLRGFLLRPDESVTHSFPRTPAFAWSPVQQARCYEFELATSRTFTENSLVWSNVRYTVGQRGNCQVFDASKNDSVTTTETAPTAGKDTSKDDRGTTEQTDPTTMVRPLRVPAVAVDVALPWFTGQPYALYAHVRAVTPKGPTKWSRSFAFNMRWPSIPEPLPTQPGLVRWSPVQGATGYQVWLLDVGKVFSSSTNVADQREYFTFHPSAAWTSTVRWRVRAVRSLYGSIPNGLPAVSYGPWSGVFTSLNSPFAGSGPLALTTSISDKVSDPSSQKSHELMPAFTWRGGSTGLYRVYITTDRDCVNVVYRSSVVGSPAYAPRTTGPNKLPGSFQDIVKVAAAAPGDVKNGVLPSSNDEGVPTYSRDGFVFKTSELVQAAGSSAGTSADSSQVVSGARVDLPDTNFPSTRYYWTVVPVAAGEVDGKFAYVDTEVPQDACAAGRIQSFGKASEPVVISSGGAPFVSGLSPVGRLLTARHSGPSVYGAPFVAWQPALGADSYEIQWSRRFYPWKATGSKVTFATSAVLDGLTPGRWYYRVRGRNSNQAKKPQMAWSAPVRFTVAKPLFAVVSR